MGNAYGVNENIFSEEETHEESRFLKGNSHLNSLLARPLARDPAITSRTAHSTRDALTLIRNWNLVPDEFSPHHQKLNVGMHSEILLFLQLSMGVFRTAVRV